MVLLIGDVQGCASALDALLARAGFSPSRDRVVLLGDLVNRGPASAAVLRRAMGWGGSCEALLGNHDLHLLALAHGVRGPKRGDTAVDVLDAPDRDALLAWLAARPLALRAEGWLCVHAGVVPAWDGAATLAHADEVRAVLGDTAAAPDFLRALFGRRPLRWDDALAGAERLRCIVDVLTRIRFCAADGTLDLDTKEGADAAPPGMRPWFDHAARATRDDRIAFGHWSTLGALDRDGLLGLDTGCVWGGALSAVRVDGGRREWIRQPCPQAQAPGPV